MSNTDYLGIKELQALTGVKLRTLQFWTDQGVLEPFKETDRQGKGVARRYDKTEALWALIATELDRYKMPVGEVRWIIDQLRAARLAYRNACAAVDGVALTRLIGAEGFDQIERGWCIQEAVFEKVVFLAIRIQADGTATAALLRPGVNEWFPVGGTAMIRIAHGPLDSFALSAGRSLLLVRLDTALAPYRSLLARVAL